MSTTDALRQVKELLSDERRWCKGGIAHDATGAKVSHPRDPEAASWCLIGALCHVSADDAAFLAVAQAITNQPQFGAATPQTPTSEFNDNSTHADIMAALDRALLLVAENTVELVAA